jgi:RNA polymerase-associated protein LEO1
VQGERPVLAQLPNFLSIETKPFDAETYDEADIEEIRDEDGKTRVRLRVENTIRWRYKTGDNGALLLDDDVCL